MKIAMLGHKWIPSREGGVEIVVNELSTRMAALGHNVTVYNRKGYQASGGKAEQLKEYKGVNKNLYDSRTLFADLSLSMSNA